MEWPDSVHVDTLGSKRRSRKDRAHKDPSKLYSTGQQEERRRLRESFPFVPSGVTLEAGSRGAASLKAERLDEQTQGTRRRRRTHAAPRKRWDWNFANDADAGVKLTLEDDFAIFYPPSIKVESTPPESSHHVQDAFKRSRAPRSRSNSRLPERASHASPKSAPANLLGDATSDERGKSPDGIDTENNNQASLDQARRSDDSEADDTAAPPGQIADPTATTLNPTLPDATQDTPDTTKAEETQLQLEDNRSALAIIKYEAKADAELFGFDTHTIYFLAFAMGERGNELNISLFKTFPSTLKRSEKTPMFIPSLAPSFVCKDRILQISVSSKRRHKYAYVCVAVRTESLVYYLLVTPINTSVFPKHQKPGDPVVKVDLLSIVDADGLEGAQAVDICMNPTHFQQCLIATDAGILYRWSMVRRASPSEGWIHEGKLVRIMSSADHTKSVLAPQFHRAVWGSREGTVVFMDACHVWFLDLENTEQLILNTMDLTGTTSLFTSLDDSAAKREADFICLSTTDMVMWIDAHDGQIAMSWDHTRRGENTQIESIATDEVGGSVFLLRCPDNSKGTFFHVHETMQGIQSRMGPYDSLLSDWQDGHPRIFGQPWFRRHIGFVSFAIPEAPSTLAFLLSLQDDGQLSCRMFKGRPPHRTDVQDSDVKLIASQKPNSTTDIQPKDLLCRSFSFDTTAQVERTIDEELMDDMDVDEDQKGMEEGQESDDQVYSNYQRIRTRDLWRSLGKTALDNNPLVSLASLRNLLNDSEQLPSSGIFTLHELLALSCETSTDEGRDQPDSLKGYSLGLLQGNDQEQLQLSELFQQFGSVLNRPDSRATDVRKTACKIDNDDTFVMGLSSSYDLLSERYLQTSASAQHFQQDREIRALQNRSTMQLNCDLHLSVPAFAFASSNALREGGNDDQISETLSRLTFDSKSAKLLPPAEYLKPVYRELPNEPTPSTISSLFTQWDPRSDPSTYVWPGLSNHRNSFLGGPTDLPATTVAASSAVETAPMASVVSLPRQYMPLTPARPVQSPFRQIPSLGASLPTPKNQSQVHFKAETQSQSQDFASTQIVQGPYGNRNAPSFRRSLGKKRTIGF